ncbi:hypothetical protein OQA88_8082 [Cercophora sp. LCS_1]
MRLRRSANSNNDATEPHETPEATDTGNTSLQQCWFAGYHADIGGSVRGAGLGSFSLVWMIDKLQDYVAFNTDAVLEPEPGKQRGNDEGTLDRRSYSYDIWSHLPSPIEVPVGKILLMGRRIPTRQFWEQRKFRLYRPQSGEPRRCRIRQLWGLRKPHEASSEGEIQHAETVHQSVMQLINMKSGVARPPCMQKLEHRGQSSTKPAELEGPSPPTESQQKKWSFEDRLPEEAMTDFQLKLIKRWFYMDNRAGGAANAEPAHDAVFKSYLEVMDWVDKLLEQGRKERAEKHGVVPQSIMEDIPRSIWRLRYGKESIKNFKESAPADSPRRLNVVLETIDELLRDLVEPLHKDDAEVQIAPEDGRAENGILLLLKAEMGWLEMAKKPDLDASQMISEIDRVVTSLERSQEITRQWMEEERLRGAEGFE